MASESTSTNSKYLLCSEVEFRGGSKEGCCGSVVSRSLLLSNEDVISRGMITCGRACCNINVVCVYVYKTVRREHG